MDKVEIHLIPVLRGDRSLSLVFTKQFAMELGIEKGDYLKCHVDGNRLIVENARPGSINKQVGFVGN
jgi:hypothetical protein